MSEQNIGNVNDVVIDKNKLLSILRENKAKHDALFEAALSGYWLASQDTINNKKSEFEKYLKTLGSDFEQSTNLILDKISKKEKVDIYSYIPIPNASFSYSINLKYPENHESEYNRAIRAVELNVYDNIKLSSNEFNQYVMNDWSWKNSFFDTNHNYSMLGATYTTGSALYRNIIALSGCNIL